LRATQENAVEEEIKSAFELAMERVSRLPELTPKEISEQKEKEHRQAGEALCHKYMQGDIEACALRSELQRYPGNSGKIVQKSLLSCFIQAIRLDDSQAAGKAMKGLLGALEDGNELQEIVWTTWSRMLGDFERHRDVLLFEMGSKAKERLAVLGISGSAILPNLNGDEICTQRLSDLQRSFEPRLDELRTLLKSRLNL
jgi:hypothetical protein